MAKKFSLFGFKIGKDDEETIIPSFAPPIIDDGALTVAAAANYGLSIDLETNYKSEVELITRYREMAMQPEIEAAIDDIVNETIIYNEHHTKPLDLNLDNLKVSTKIKNAIDEEFQNILTLLNFRNLGSDIFRRYYVDGRLYYNILVDQENPNKGIQELRYIDPRKLTKIREVQKEKDRTTGVEMILGVKEYYIYSDSASMKSITNQQVGLRIATDTIIDITSGLMDAKRSIVLSYLHKCIKPLNMLRQIEDASVIYKLCLIGDTRIKTNIGWKYIKDIKPNDSVYSFYGHDGLKETKVSAQWKTGCKQTYKVSSKHHEIVGTDNHPILVLDKSTDIVDYVEIKDIVPKRHCFVYQKPVESNQKIKFPDVRHRAIKILNPEVFLILKIENKEHYIKQLSEVFNIKVSTARNFLYGLQFLESTIAYELLDELNIIDDCKTIEKYENMNFDTIYNLPEYIDEEFARLYGFLIGDGTISKNRICFAEGVDEIQNKFYANILRKYFGKCVRYNSKRKYTNYYTANTLGAELLTKLGFHNGAKIKRIPTWLWECSDSIKKEFILGLADADGCNKNSIYTDMWYSEIQLCNKQLVEDIKELWNSLGLASGKIRYTKRKAEFRIIGNETVERLIPETESWSVYISEAPISKFEPIFTITEEKLEDVYELEVVSEKHNFIANGIVVHNSRAPERRIFYVDVGNLPKMKAEQYLKDLMTKYKNKVVFDSSTGNVTDSRKYLSLTEDFWMPRRSDRSTEVTTLPSSGAFDDMSMVEYFEKKLYKALNVPFSRLMQPETPFSVGRSSEISRDEIKFSKFVNRLRLKFVDLFDQALRVQCVLKGICTSDEFDEYKQDFIYDWLEDNNYAELKDAELISNRVNLLQSVDPFLGKYYSKNWIQTNILNMNEDEIKEINEEIQEDIDNQVYPDPRLMNDPSLMGQDIPQDGYNDVASNGMQDSFPPAKQSNNIQPENPYYDQK